MNNYTEKKIEEQLEQLQSIEPGAESLRRMNRRIQNMVVEAEKKSTIVYGLSRYAVASAAVLLIGIGLLYTTNTIEQKPFVLQPTPAAPDLSLARLNIVFNKGGQQALNDYFEKIESQRQPRVKSVTLQEMLKEL